jgi:hypothetical protein
MFLIVRIGYKDNELSRYAHPLSSITKICARELFFKKERVYFVQKSSDDYVHPFQQRHFHAILVCLDGPFNNDFASTMSACLRPLSSVAAWVH